MSNVLIGYVVWEPASMADHRWQHN